MAERDQPDTDPDVEESLLDDTSGDTDDDLDPQDSDLGGEDDPPDDDGSEPEPPANTRDQDQDPPRRETRGSRQFGQLREKARRLERENEELRQRSAPPQVDHNAAAQAQRERDQAAENDVLLTGDPVAISRFYSARAEASVRADLNRMQFHQTDTADRQEFRTYCRENPVVGRIKDEVEERLAKARRQGFNPPRESIAHVILGEKLAKSAVGAQKRQQTRADSERTRQTGRPGAGRGDHSSGSPGTARRGGGNSQSDRARRLDESGQL